MGVLNNCRYFPGAVVESTKTVLPSEALSVLILHWSKTKKLVKTIEINHGNKTIEAKP